MTPLTQEFVDSCPEEAGFRQRGIEMTRLEVFIDAAFAFAVTMLVISFDAMPANWDEIIIAVKNIPAFAVAVAQLVWIWYEHSVWSRRYGLDDATTVFLSAVLLIVMLVYIYPMRIMAGGMFNWMTDGYLPSSFDINSWDELSGMFVFLGVGFAALCAVFVLLYRHSARCSEQLLLNEEERFHTRTVTMLWTGSAGIGLLSVTGALLLEPPWIPFAGFAYMLMSIWMPWFSNWRRKQLRTSLDSIPG